MRFVGNRPLVHHAREDDTVEVRLRRTLFSNRVVRRRNVLFIAASNCIEVSTGLTWNLCSKTSNLLISRLSFHHIADYLSSLFENLRVASHVACVPKRSIESEKQCTLA